MLRVLLFTLLLILLVIIVSHFFLPILGGVIVFSTLAWGALIATIVLFCVGVLLVFILTGIGVIILGLFFAGWIVAAIIFFPILLPIILPLFILFLFIRYMVERNQKLRANENIGIKDKTNE